MSLGRCLASVMMPGKETAVKPPKKPTLPSYLRDPWGPSKHPSSKASFHGNETLVPFGLRGDGGWMDGNPQEILRWAVLSGEQS